jgi:hypothetical protein
MELRSEKMMLIVARTRGCRRPGCGEGRQQFRACWRHPSRRLERLERLVIMASELRTRTVLLVNFRE